jgi:hypothetical protein
MAIPFDLKTILNATADISYSATTKRDDFHLKLLAYADRTLGDYSISVKDDPEQESELQTAYSRLRRLDGDGDGSVTLPEAIAKTGEHLVGLTDDLNTKKAAYQNALDALPYPRTAEAIEALAPLKNAYFAAHEQYIHEIALHNDLLELQLKTNGL